MLTALTVRATVFLYRMFVHISLKALNVVIRMLPLQTHPFNTRSFFTDAEKKDVGQGFQLWRGYFQSLRPASGRLLVNIDLSTGMFYKPGPLMNIALEASGLRDPRDLTATAFDHRRLRELERFLSGVRVSVQPAGGGPPNIVVIHSLTREGATNIRFEREGRQTNVAAYYRELTNRALQFPNMICAKVCELSSFFHCVLTQILDRRRKARFCHLSDVLSFLDKSHESRYLPT